MTDKSKPQESSQDTEQLQKLQSQVYALQGMLAVTEQQRNQAMSALAQAEVRANAMRAELEHIQQRQSAAAANSANEKVAA